MKKIHLTVLFLLITVPVLAGDVAMSGTPGQAVEQPSDLTLWNFFTEGWDQAWVHRVTPGGAPDMALLHVQTNFLEREFRLDGYDQQNVGSDDKRAVTFADALIAYSLNRRFMMEVVSEYEWKVGRDATNSLGGAAAAVQTRLQLVDVPGSSYAFNFRVTSPDDGIDMKQTTLSPSLAGWQDLTCLGLKKVGLYYHILEDSYVGPANKGTKTSDLTYDVSIAKTWTEPDTRYCGNLTTFLEFWATTNLDGSDRDQTTLNMTPAVRVSLGHGNVLMAGVDVPVSTPQAFDITYRLTYILNF